VPSIVRDMLKLPEANLIYKGEEARNLLKRKNNGIELLQEYLHDPASMSMTSYTMISIRVFFSVRKKTLYSYLYGYTCLCLVDTTSYMS